VKGNQQHPLYKWLTSKENHPSYGGKITWNFNKFLISPSGEVIARFGSRQSPIDDQIIAAIESTLPDAVYK
jgi:glutathione peroxidase